MARYALIALLALALCAAPAAEAALAIQEFDLDVSGNSIIITRASDSGDPTQPIFDNSWITNLTGDGTSAVCVGQILYAVYNAGDSPVSPSVYGPITASAPADSKLFLVSPTAFQYSTTAAEGDLFANGIQLTQLGYYSDSGQTSVFALTMGCPFYYDPENPPSGSCNCNGTEAAITFVSNNKTSGRTSDICGTTAHPGTYLGQGVCVNVARQNQTNTGLDEYWTDGHSRCIGHTLFTITNNGLSDINQLSTSNGATMTITLGGSTLHQFYAPGVDSSNCCEYNYYSDNLQANGTTATVLEAGYYMIPGGTSTFAVTTWCKAACPCTGATIDITFSGSPAA